MNIRGLMGTKTDRFKSLKFVSMGLVLMIAVLFGLTARINQVSALPGSVVINEIMYNPPQGDNYEFLELFNTTGAPINLGGWCFTAGINHCFPSDTVLPANGYLTVVAVESIARNYYANGWPVYGFSYVQYTGSLSNGGETVTLRDNTNTIIDTVTYSDSAPWPKSPDGAGRSLELKDPTLDNSLSSSWAASRDPNGWTPYAQNSWVGLTPPEIGTVVKPTNVTPNQAATVTAQITDATSVELIYQVMFGSDQTVLMFDDGNHNDGPASDGVYGAQIPAQAAGDLVRYRVRAIGNDGDVFSPSSAETVNHHGYVVENSAVNSNAPVIEWFMSDATYDDMHANHVFDNLFLPAVVAYDGVVYDNSQVRIRGEASRFDPKKSFKFKLPVGYTIQPDGAGLAVDEFNLVNNTGSSEMGLIPSAWWTIGQAGLPKPDVLPARLERNAEFEGLYLYMDKYESQWRQANGYNSGEMYEDGSMTFNGANNLNNLASFQTAMLVDDESAAKRSYILDNLDVAKTFNFIAAGSLLGVYDTNTRSNSLTYRDNNNRWSMLFWDIDGIFNSDVTLSPMMFRPDWYESAYSFAPVYMQADLRQLYFRRLRTVIDKVFSQDQLKQQYDAMSDLHADDMALDLAKWPVDGEGNPRSSREGRLPIMKRNALVYQRVDWLVPAAQTDNERQQVYIEQVDANISAANEYIKIASTAATPVDISGWEIEGINYTIPAGTVVPANGNGSIYLVRDDVAYKAGHAPVLIFGEYTTSLNNNVTGEITLRTDQGVEVDSYVY